MCIKWRLSAGASSTRRLCSTSFTYNLSNPGLDDSDRALPCLALSFCSYCCSTRRRLLSCALGPALLAQLLRSGRRTFEPCLLAGRAARPRRFLGLTASLPFYRSLVHALADRCKAKDPLAVLSRRCAPTFPNSPSRRARAALLSSPQASLAKARWKRTEQAASVSSYQSAASSMLRAPLARRQASTVPLPVLLKCSLSAKARPRRPVSLHQPQLTPRGAPRSPRA